jgi:hypothetical protein
MVCHIKSLMLNMLNVALASISSIGSYPDLPVQHKFA